MGSYSKSFSPITQDGGYANFNRDEAAFEGLCHASWLQTLLSGSISVLDKSIQSSLNVFLLLNASARLDLEPDWRLWNHFYYRRHKRYGHLFQNRYKSILRQEDSYLLELVRYIHLNPLKARLVADMKELDRFVYCGHNVLVEKWTI